eukprot:gene14007-4248_t
MDDVPPMTLPLTPPHSPRSAHSLRSLVSLMSPRAEDAAGPPGSYGGPCGWAVRRAVRHGEGVDERASKELFIGPAITVSIILSLLIASYVPVRGWWNAFQFGVALV